MREIDGRTGEFVCLSESLESLTNRTGQHRKFGAALLLFQNDQRLIKVRITPRKLISQNIHLRMLTSQAENGSAGDIWMVDVSRYQSTQFVGVFARPATAALVQKKLDAVDIRKELAGFRYVAVVRLSRNLELFAFPFAI